MPTPQDALEFRNRLRFAGLEQGELKIVTVHDKVAFCAGEPMMRGAHNGISGLSSVLVLGLQELLKSFEKRLSFSVNQCCKHGSCLLWSKQKASHRSGTRLGRAAKSRIARLIWQNSQ